MHTTGLRFTTNQVSATRVPMNDARPCTRFIETNRAYWGTHKQAQSRSVSPEGVWQVDAGYLNVGDKSERLSSSLAAEVAPSARRAD